VGEDRNKNPVCERLGSVIVHKLSGYKCDWLLLKCKHIVSHSAILLSSKTAERKFGVSDYPLSTYHILPNLPRTVIKTLGQMPVPERKTP
jgi:hypothetical protein